MFAASLNTLKKRTGQLLSKAEDWVREDDAEVAAPVRAADGSVLVRYVIQNARGGGGGCGYRDDGDREPAHFALPAQVVPPGGVTVGLIRRCFPLTGRFHFRFKSPAPDGFFGGFVWADPRSDEDAVPAHRGGIEMKVLRLPASGASAGARLPLSAPKALLPPAPQQTSEAPSEAAAAAAPPQTVPPPPPASSSAARQLPLGVASSGGAAEQRRGLAQEQRRLVREQEQQPQAAAGQPAAAAAAAAAAAPAAPTRPNQQTPMQRTQSNMTSMQLGGGGSAGQQAVPVVNAAGAAAHAAAERQRRQSAPATSASPPAAPMGDLMEMDSGSARPAAAGAGGAGHGGAAAPPPSGGGSGAGAAAPAAAPPAPALNREELVAKREAEKEQRIQQALARTVSQRMQEEELNTRKVELAGQLKAEMEQWARMPDGITFKDIRTLLSTMHEVIWKDSAWKEVPLSELISDKSIKSHYRRAIVICHPDRQQEAPPEQQFRADRIFNAINEAFNASNPSNKPSAGQQDG